MYLCTIKQKSTNKYTTYEKDSYDDLPSVLQFDNVC